MPDTGNVPIQILQGGSVLQIASGGSINVLAGGSVQNAGAQSVASGGVLNVASGGSILVASGGSIQAATGVYIGTLNLGGQTGRWAWGTIGFSGGVGTIATGLATCQSFTANAIGANIGAGTFSGVQIDMSLCTSGSVIVRALTGSLAFAAGGTLAWQAFGV